MLSYFHISRTLSLFLPKADMQSYIPSAQDLPEGKIWLFDESDMEEDDNEDNEKRIIR